MHEINFILINNNHKIFAEQKKCTWLFHFIVLDFPNLIIKICIKYINYMIKAEKTKNVGYFNYSLIALIVFQRNAFTKSIKQENIYYNIFLFQTIHKKIIKI